MIRKIAARAEGLRGSLRRIIVLRMVDLALKGKMIVIMISTIEVIINIQILCPVLLISWTFIPKMPYSMHKQFILLVLLRQLRTHTVAKEHGI
jgi:hypothetical protein